MLQTPSPKVVLTAIATQFWLLSYDSQPIGTLALRPATVGYLDEYAQPVDNTLLCPRVIG